MRKRPLLVVEWEDATSSSKWCSEKEAEVKPAIVHSVGWKMEGDRKYVLLASQRDVTYGECADRLRIPRGCIKNIRRLE